MREKRTKKDLDRAEDRLQDAQDRLKRAEEKQDKAAAKARAKNADLKPAQAKKLDAAIEEEQKNVAKAEKELARAQTKHARTVAKSGTPETASAVDIDGMDALAAAAALQNALAGSIAVAVTGEVQTSGEPLALELAPGMTVLWQASLKVNGPQAALSLRSAPGAEDAGKLPAPMFCIADGGLILNDGEGGSLIECSGDITVKVDGGTLRSAHGDGIRTDGPVEIVSGVVAADGTGGKAAAAIQAGTVQLQGGFVFGRAPSKSDAGNGSLSKAAVIQPCKDDALKGGAGCVCVWVTEDGAMPALDGSEDGLVFWPEDACVWWDVDPDGATSVYAGRQNQSNSVEIGTQSLPAPPDMQTAGNEVITLPIVFDAKTETAERPVLLDIQWGWDLFLTKKGAKEYDNRLAIAACALSNSVYHEDGITALFERLGFADPDLQNYGSINVTSAFAFAHAQVQDGRTAKTIFAVVNRGSATLMDWKGNILDETIQNAGFFGQSADTVAEALRGYVRKYGQPDPEDNIFFVTGHSLGAIVTDLLATQHFQEYPARNVFAYAFAAPLADPESQVDESRPVYNILNQNDVVTSFPPRGGYKRVGSENYTFGTTGKSAQAMARPFRFLSHMDIDALAHMSSFTGFFKKAVPSIMWNHSLTTYMAYLLAGGPDSVKTSGGLWSMVQNIIAAAGNSNS
ncbi:MAG: hypothetical protein HDQ87_06210 [Clostridia bacterium]|nr:hypothetical protein [Clostridia bacterium]